MKAKKLIALSLLAILLLSILACGGGGGAKFVVYNLSITPSSAEVGQQVTISVAVENLGDDEGTKEIIVKVNGEVIDRGAVWLAQGVADTLTFTYTPTAEGTYDIEVDGESGSLIVSAPPGPQ